MPYLEAVEHLVPLHEIQEIKTVKYRNCFPSHHALIEKTKYKFKIILRVYERSIPASTLNQELVLNSLSHELAHMEKWEEPEASVTRFYLETKIYARFGEKLLQLGYEVDRNKI